MEGWGEPLPCIRAQAGDRCRQAVDRQRQLAPSGAGAFPPATPAAARITAGSSGKKALILSVS